MKKTALWISLILMVVLSCSQSSQIPTPRESSIDLKAPELIEGDLSIQLPDWDTTQSEDQQVIHSLSNGIATVWVKPWPMIPRLVAENVHIWIDNTASAGFIAEQAGSERTALEMTIQENGTTLHLSSVFVYCNAQTYEVTYLADETNFSQYQSLFQKSLNTIACNRPEGPARLTKGALGMVVLPKANDENIFDLGDYQQALALASSSGVQVSHYYTQWGDIEKEPGVYDWGTPDYIFEAHQLEGLQISVVVNIIHTTVRGRVPPDLEGKAFDDPVFVERLKNFLVAFSDRYSDRVHYLAIGNEVNDYFYAHRDEIEAYASTFDLVREAIHQHNPDLPVGMVFAYHDAETLEALDIIPMLNRGDYIAFTLYLYNEGFHFTREPSLIAEYLDRMIAISDGKPIAITETGWSTAAVLDGTEADQTEYVRQVFAALRDRREHILFLSWFDMHDSRQDYCHEQALTFFLPGQEPSAAEMEAFVTFLCYFGLRNADGSPKPAWDEWVNQAKDYQP